MLMVPSPGQARDVLQAFGLAVRANDASFLARLPQLGLDERTRDDLRNNLLMIAIRDDGQAIALGLLRQKRWQTKEVLNYENQLGETALMIAAVEKFPYTVYDAAGKVVVAAEADGVANELPAGDYKVVVKAGAREIVVPKVTIGLAQTKVLTIKMKDGQLIVE